MKNAYQKSNDICNQFEILLLKSINLVKKYIFQDEQLSQRLSIFIFIKYLQKS